MSEPVTILISPAGEVTLLYQEHVSLTALGPHQIRRVSRVEPDDRGRWYADLSPCGGPRLGPYALRSQALAAEVRWIAHHRLRADA